MRLSVIFGLMLLVSAPAPAAAEMSGEAFYAMCLTKPTPCAAFIKRVLWDWPEYIIHPEILLEGRMEQKACPPFYPNDRWLTRLFLNGARIFSIAMKGRTARDAVETVFVARSPHCAAAKRA